MDLQEQIDTGKQAEDFLRYLADHPYFEGLLERVKLELARGILELSPNDAEVFVRLRCKMDGVSDIMNAVRGDVYLAQEAYKRANGLVDEDKGLL
jgi:hypothetical protein